MKKKTNKIKSRIIIGLSQCLMAYAVIISLAPCSGEWR